MKLLWAHGWKQPDDDGFMLLPHQFAAVRFVAGVAASWPSSYPPASFPRGVECAHGLGGGGTGLAAACDIVLSAAEATYGFS